MPPLPVLSGAETVWSCEAFGLPERGAAERLARRNRQPALHRRFGKAGKEGQCQDDGDSAAAA